MNRLIYCILIVMVPCLLSSCNSKLFGGKKNKKKAESSVAQGTDTTKVAVVPEPKATVTNVPVPTPGSALLIAELAPLWNKRLQYKTFSGKAKIGLEGPDLSHDLVANFRIAKDSVIWVHVSALGGIVSVARIYITQDSFFMLNYQAKEVTRLSLADVARILPVQVRFNQLQNLFSGDPMAEGTITTAEVKDQAWSLSTEDSSYMQQVTYQKADSTLILGYLKTRDPNGPTALIDYHNYEMAGSRRISTNRIVHIQNGLKNYTLDMNIIGPEFDKELEFPFSIPGNYTLKNK